MPGNRFLLQGIFKVFLAELLIPNVIHLVDISGNVRRHIKAPRASTQEQAENDMESEVVNLAERYTVRLKWYHATALVCAFAHVFTCTKIRQEYGNSHIFSLLFLFHLSEWPLHLFTYPYCELFYRWV